MRPTEVWVEAWNKIVRDLYKNTTFKKLILLPAKTTIVEFVDKYFVENGFSNDIVIDEAVRVVYGIVRSEDTDSPGVKQAQLSFDIFVKRDRMRDADPDRLKLRTKLIANFLFEYLTNNKNAEFAKYLKGHKFRVKSEQTMTTRAQNYVRYNITFYFMKTY